MRILQTKKPKADQTRLYSLRIEIGLIIGLLIFIVLFHVPFHMKNKENFQVPHQEEITMKTIKRTEIKKKPPPPPAPRVPVAVPNDAVISDNPINLNSELNLDQPLSLPPPPEKGNGQAEQTHKQQVFVVVERMPKMKGGLKALEKNIVYPEMARKAGIEGTVYVQFIVNKQGVPTHIQVTRGVTPGLNQAAVNAIKKVRFTPGMQRGRPVAVRMSIPVRFQLEIK